MHIVSENSALKESLFLIQNPTDPSLNYVTLAFTQPKPRQVYLSDIHRCEEPVLYASIEYGKVGPPPQKEVEEEPIWETLPQDEGWNDGVQLN